MSGYTPGPWTADEERVYFGREGGISLHNAPNPEANARLIAAAPELLESCQWLKPYAEAQVRNYPDGEDTPHWTALLAAIRKATEAAS